MRVRLFFIIIFSLFNISGVFSLDLKILEDNREDYSFGPGDYEIFEDTSAKMSIDEVRQEPTSVKFILNEAGYSFNENPASAYWIRFKYVNLSKKHSRWILEGLAQQTGYLQVFIPDRTGKYIFHETGTSLNFPMREYMVKNLAFDIPSDYGIEYTIYIRVRADNHSGFMYNIRSNNYFTHFNITEYFTLGLYYGILLIMALYNLLLFISIREKAYFYYVVYVLSCVLRSSSEDGLGFQYLWPHHPLWNIPIDYYIAQLFFMVSFIMYATSFLNLAKTHPLFSRIQWGVTGAYFIYFICQVSFPNLVPYISGIYAVPFISMYVITILTLVKGYKPARYFVIGYTFIFLSIIITQLRFMNAIESNAFTIYCFNVSILIEVLMLSFAMGDRFRIIKKEKERAQSDIIRELSNKEVYKNALIKQLQENESLKDKVNMELEQKVTERTIDLQKKSGEVEEANKKLQLAIDGLSKMNMELDLNNWGLKKKVTEETKLRILSEEVSYEEFLKIFPDETACFRYLEEIKWGKDYHCKKCGNEKFREAKAFSRKCTKCGYTESVTAATLFHSIKFPINKAFFIVYITNNKKNKITIEELSIILSLRKNTCWAFRKKVQETKDELQNKNGGKDTGKWENLFLEH